MKIANCLTKSFDALLLENDVLCQQLAKLQGTASKIIQEKSALIDELILNIKFLRAELKSREAMILFLQTKLTELRKTNQIQSH